MPLDSNLPTYYFKPPNDKNRPAESTVLFTQFDSDPEPRYVLKHAEPTSPQGRNVYAAAILDAYTTDVVFGEILVKPEWTQPTLSQEEIRKHGGVPPPPVPIIPKSVTVQLYAPDQQVLLEEQPGSWGNAPTYHFQMPQQTFRLPSASRLDYSANDPGADVTTPQIQFMWKRDGRKDLKCYVTGKSTDKGKKKKGGKEPPIIVAIMSDFKELTIYESNLHRVEMEDYKGLEVVLLLGAVVIRDMWCGQKKDVFNAGEAPRKNSAAGGLLNRRPSMQLLSTSASNVVASSQLQPNGLVGRKRQQSIPPPQSSGPPGVPPPDARAQWEIDAETVRLQKLYKNEQQAEEAKRKERARRDEEEARRIRKMLEQEEKEQRKQQAAIQKESQRLARIYGQPTLAPPRPPPPQRQSFPPFGHPVAAAAPPPPQPPRPWPRPQNGPYLQPNGLVHRPAASQSSFFGGGGGGGGPSRPQPRPQPPPSMASGGRPPRPVSQAPPELQHKKSSFWGFLSGDPAPRLRSQRSTMF